MRQPMMAVAAALLAATAVPGQTGAGVEKPRLRIHLMGAAEIVGSRLRLTRATRQTTGGAWFPEKQRISGGFEAVFRFQLTDQGGLGPGADGFAFVLQNAGTDALAGRGSAGGFALGDGWGLASSPGIPRSIAVFFDTYLNRDGDDPSDNYIGICTNGPIATMRWPPRRLGVSKNLKTWLKDGREHLVRIRYKPPLMMVYLDKEEPSVVAAVDVSTVVDEAGRAYVGFTASTGNGYQNHDILGWAFTPSTAVSSDTMYVHSEITYLPFACLEGRNLCTPAEAMVEEKGPGRYHVILPAQLQWGASIANPDGRKVTIAGARGTACWDAAHGGCGGPEGDALISKFERGRTWFSVKGRKDGRFRENQGYFEFDVRVE